MSTIEVRDNSKLRCIAVDDEPFARKLIADDIGKVPVLDLVATCASPVEALDYIQAGKVDLLFLDIQMPVIKGTDFLRTIQNPPMVIITTAFEAYALEGYDLNVIDYLVKPIPFERFLKAVNKAYDHFLLHHGNGKKEKPPSEFIFVHAEYRQIRIAADDIRYIEGLKDYVKIHLVNQPKPVLTRLNLKGMESKLPPAQFCRIHNSFIVSLSKITSVQKSQVFIGKDVIPVGEKFSADFQRRFRSTD
jgi:DNA-binding LytR/AlgR family response regulator